MEIKTIDGSIYPFTLNLTNVDGSTLSGTYSGGYGEIPVKGTLYEDQIKFCFYVEGYKVGNSGTVGENEMQGKVVVEAYTEGTFKGTRN